jgi:dihydrodipicolinate synthase/N-acetylneuraminate lyase
MLPGAECPAEHAELHHLWFAGEHAGAEALYRRILPLLSFKMQSLPFLVAATKALLRHRGVLSDERARISEPLDEWSRAALLQHWERCVGAAASGSISSAAEAPWLRSA